VRCCATAHHGAGSPRHGGLRALALRHNIDPALAELKPVPQLRGEDDLI
jgi:hypothetical protein